MNSIEKAKAALEDSNSILAGIGGEGWAQAQAQILDNNEAIAALASLPTGEPVNVPSVEQVEDEVGMSSFAWDCIPAEDIINAVLKLAAPIDRDATTVSQDDKRDAGRLDWLDAVNRRMNERNGTVYGWKFDINHNRAALTDHNFPALSVRAAIDAAIQEAK